VLFVPQNNSQSQLSEDEQKSLQSAAAGIAMIVEKYAK